MGASCAQVLHGPSAHMATAPAAFAEFAGPAGYLEPPAIPKRDQWRLSSLVGTEAFGELRSELHRRNRPPKQRGCHRRCPAQTGRQAERNTRRNCLRGSGYPNPKRAMIAWGKVSDGYCCSSGFGLVLSVVAFASKLSYICLVQNPIRCPSIAPLLRNGRERKSPCPFYSYIEATRRNGWLQKGAFHACQPSCSEQRTLRSREIARDTGNKCRQGRNSHRPGVDLDDDDSIRTICV